MQIVSAMLVLKGCYFGLAGVMLKPSEDDGEVLCLLRAFGSMGHLSGKDEGWQKKKDAENAEEEEDEEDA